MPNELSDEDLVSRLQKGDETAFSFLMERYTGKLLRYGERLMPYEHTIGDTVQDIFVTMYKNINDFDTTRKFSPWIYRIAHNAFVDNIRKKTKEPVFVFDLDTIMPHIIQNEDPLLVEKEREEIRVLIGKGLEKVSPAYREIIGLYYFENFSYREIADILHIPIGTVGIRLSRARAELKKNLPEHHYE